MDSPAVKRAFLAAMMIAAMCVVVAFFNPLDGIASAAICLAVAWGLRRRQVWAAITGGCVLVAAVLAAATRVSPDQAIAFAAVAAIEVALSWFFWKAWWELRKDPQASASPMPWAAILAACAVYWLVFQPYSMPSASMESTILVGDCALVETASWRFGREPHRGDVLLFHYPVDRKQVFTKRVAGVPGDRVKVVDKKLFVNGAAVSEPYAEHVTSFVDSFRDNFPSAPTGRLAEQALDMLGHHVQDGEVVVPPGEYFVLGDNRDDSFDSRYWGFVSRSEIIGSPVMIYASFDAGGTEPSKNPGTILNMRWNRLLKRL